jgi:hypothetical protein
MNDTLYSGKSSPTFGAAKHSYGLLGILFDPEDRCGIFLRNIGELLLSYNVSHHRG